MINKNEKIEVLLNSKEAIVLFEFLSRVIDSSELEKLSIVESEMFSIYALHNQLEDHIPEVLHPDYENIVSKARIWLKNNFGGETP